MSIRTRTRNRLAAALIALAAGALVMVPVSSALGAPPAPSGTTVEVHIKQASIADHAGDCTRGATSAEIILNQIATAPASISVWLSDGSLVSVWLTNQTGFTGHYIVGLASGQSVTDATAIVPSNWSGQFVLSHYNCGPGSTPTPTPPAS